MKVKIFVFAVLLWTVSVSLTAQTRPSDPDLKQFQKQLAEMQKQLMQQFKDGFSMDGFQLLGDTSSFFFKVDTTLSWSDSNFFQFKTPDSFGDLLNSPEDFFGRFFDLSKRYDKFDKAPEGSEFLNENGDSDLLPEERLREKESNTPPSEHPRKTPETPKKERKKTVRI